MPSVTNLSLVFGTCDRRCYGIEHNPWKRYNCPKVESISVVAPKPGHILATINPGNPTNIRSLVVEAHSEDRFVSDETDCDTAVMAYNRLLQNTPQLVVLEIATLVKRFPVSLLRENEALRSLRLQDMRPCYTERLLFALFSVAVT
jgi:hypothetical protein